MELLDSKKIIEKFKKVLRAIRKNARNKSEIIIDIVWIFLVAILFLLFYIYPENNFKLISGGVFLIILGLTEILRRRKGLLGIFSIISGAIALLVAFLLPNYVNLFLFGFYFGFLIILIFILGFYVKVGDSLQEKLAQCIFRPLYLTLSAFLMVAAYKLIKGIIPSYMSATSITWTEYMLFIIVVFTSLISFYLFIDNLLRLVVFVRNSPEIFPKINYHAYHSFFISLSMLIVVGGYFYINNQENNVFRKLMIVIGLAFFTTLAISNGFKNLLKKN